MPKIGKMTDFPDFWNDFTGLNDQACAVILIYTVITTAGMLYHVSTYNN